MKTRNVFALASGIILLMGCTRPDLPPASDKAAVGKQAVSAQLRLDQAIPAGNVTLRLLEINDSRCPINAMCIRYGSAVANIAVQDAAGNNTTQRLYLGDALMAPDNRGFRAADSVEVSLAGKKYLLVLSEVHPFPNTSDENPPKKTAKVTVKAF